MKENADNDVLLLGNLLQHMESVCTLMLRFAIVIFYTYYLNTGNNK